MSRNEVFQTRWTVRNTGDTWLVNSTDLVYVKGNRFRATNGVDMNTTVQEGKRVTLPAIRMRAPDAKGIYSANWSLRIGDNYFCPLTVKIQVK